MPNSDRAEMNHLIDHLSKVISEDEQVALACWSHDWALGDDRGDSLVADAEGGGVVCWLATGDRAGAQHIARHDPRRELRRAAAIKQVINDYRMSDRACMRSDDPGSPEYATLRAGRDAFATVLRAFATATGWKG